MEKKDNCVFCQIIEGQEEAKVRHQDDEFMVFDDVNPKVPEHVLIVPREHVEDMREADDDQLEEMIELARKLAIDWQLEHFKVQINNGRKAGQIVDHLHMHLLGWNSGEEVA